MLKKIQPVNRSRFETLPGVDIEAAAIAVLDFCDEYDTEAELVFNGVVLYANPRMEVQHIVNNYHWKKS